MRNQFDQVPYLKEALLAYAADLEMQIGHEEAQKVLQRIVKDFGWWHEHIASTKGEDVERETWSDLKKLKMFWDAYVAHPELSVKYLYDNPEKGSQMLDFTEKEASFPKKILNEPRDIEDLKDAMRRAFMDVVYGGSGYDTTQKSRVDLPFPLKSKKPGRPGLSRNDVVDRIARAIWGKELKSSEPKKTWKVIAREIVWPLGFKLLEDARHRYDRLIEFDEDSILPEAKQKLAELKEKKENN